MRHPRSTPFRSSVPWSRVLLAAGTLTLCALGGVHPLARPHFAVAALLSAGGRTTPSHQTASRGGAHRPAARPATVPVSAPQAQMLALINAERAQAGVGPLHFDVTLNAIAQARSQDMIARHYFAHEIPGIPGVHMVFDLLDHDHVSYQMAGENIALNTYIDFYPMTQTVQQTNTDLMNSPEHRANLLEPHYTRIGVGMAVEQGTGKLILTEDFVQP
jgi:uncharacterized protein YkwD